MVLVLLIGVVTGVVIASFFIVRQVKKIRNRAQSERKEARKEKIMETLRQTQSKQISSEDVQELFGVTYAGAYNYLEELERERKIRQVGKTGRSVYYEKI